MARTSNSLFSNAKFSDYQRSKRDELKKDISGLTSTELENSTDSLVLILTSKHTPSTIELHEPNTEDIGQIEKTKRINALVKYIVGESKNCSDNVFQRLSARFAEDLPPKLERSEIRCQFVF